MNKRLMLAGLVAVLLLVALAQQDAGAAYESPQVASLDALRAASAEPLTVHFTEGVPRVVLFNVAAVGDGHVERARNFLEQYAPLYRQDHPEFSFELIGSDRIDRQDQNPLDIVGFQQTYRGLPIHGGVIAVMLEDDELERPRVIATFSTLLISRALEPIVEMDTVSAITTEMAAQNARDHIQCPSATRRAQPKLMIHDPLIGGEESDPRLVWRVTLGGCGHRRLLVDANSGEVILDESLVSNAGRDVGSLSLWLADAEGTNMVPRGCIFTVNDLFPFVGSQAGVVPDYSDEIDAVQAHLSIRQTWLDYHERFNLHSYDGGGGLITAWIFSGPWEGPTAMYWHGCGMEFPPGWVSLDVVAHEFGHGVQRYGLFGGPGQTGQAGSAGEAFSDIMAATLVDDDDWLIGEERTSGAGAFRSLEDPRGGWCGPAGGGGVCDDPDRFSEYGSSLGIHANAGIINKAFYLISAGGSFNGWIVNGMGRFKASRLLYPIMRFWATWSINFEDIRHLTVLQAQISNGFFAADVCTVRNAFRAVEIGMGDSNCDGVEDNFSDVDNDGIPDIHDNCLLANPDQLDADNNGIGDVCEPDSDGDGLIDLLDPCFGSCRDCNLDGNWWPTDTNDDDGDTVPDDGDGSGDYTDNRCASGQTVGCDDNCECDPNPDQYDGNNNGLGDACDPDHDGDGWYTSLGDPVQDNCPWTANLDQADADSDGLGDVCDKCPEVADNIQAWTNPIPEFGLDPQPYQPDSDDDGIPDACDPISFGFYSFLFNGQPPNLLNGVTPDSAAHAIQVAGPAGSGSAFNVRFFPCDVDNEEGVAFDETVELIVLDLVDDIDLWVEDDLGRTTATFREVAAPAPTRGLRFQPRCDHDYFLTVRPGGGFSGDAAFSLTASVTPVTPDSPWAVFTEPEPVTEPTPPPDTDGDGLIDLIDTCPGDYDPTGVDRDNDFIGDVCDNCSNTPNRAQLDADTDDIGDACDTCTDTDTDGYGNPGFPANTCDEDNCPDDSNADQANDDGDPAGDACDCGQLDPETYPGAPEVNDAQDNQCPGDFGHGITDEITGVCRVDRTSHAWPPQEGATRYQYARSTRRDFAGVCLTGETDSPAWTDSEEPDSGQVFYYLVRADLPHAGSWGRGAWGLERMPECTAGLPKRVFVTSQDRDGDLGGLSAADLLCNQLAGAAGLPGFYKAWLSDGIDSPGTTFLASPEPYVLVDGSTVAVDWNDLTDGTLAHAINKDELGNVVSVNAVWTGTSETGTSEAWHCEGWTTNCSDQCRGQRGATTLMDAGWTTIGWSRCDSSRRIYCFQQ